MTSADWTVYNNGTKRLHYSMVPTSDIAAEGISCNSYGEQENGSEILNQRYIYRGYLQVAACDQTRSGHPILWLMLWDPTEPIATRPLAIRKDGTWYCYGWDLTKNVCEVFGQHGYIRTAYTYTTYGAATVDGDVTQPLPWSSEYADEELGLTYYNYRHYNPTVGRWLGRDSSGEKACANLYDFVRNNGFSNVDQLGELWWLVAIAVVGVAGIAYTAYKITNDLTDLAEEVPDCKGNGDVYEILDCKKRMSRVCKKSTQLIQIIQYEKFMQQRTYFLVHM